MAFDLCVHQIPITSSERAFVSALLARAIERGNRDVVGAAAVIAATPARADGLINVVLPETDRHAVFDVVERKLPELRMKAGDLKRFTPPDVQEAEASAAGWDRAGKRLFNMFGPVAID